MQSLPLACRRLPQLEALKVFCDVAQYRSISQAAQANDLTQSAASHVVLQLERQLGVQLVDRSTRPLQLTAMGRTYYEGCKLLVEQYLELEASIRRTHAQVDVTVLVAAIYSVGLGDMGQCIERFTTLNPGARVHIEYLHPDRVLEKVLDGSVDFGLLSFPRKARELEIVPWREEEMVLACAPNHPLAQLEAVEVRRLAGEKYVGFDRGLVIRREVDRFLHRHGVTIGVMLEFDNIENIKKAIEVGAGVALLPAPTVRQEVQTGTLAARPLVGARLVRPVSILHRRGHRLGTAAQRFLQLLQESACETDSTTESQTAAARGAERNGNGQHAASRRKR
jgi:DNA-binding transcriptional LysR family regulator